MRKFIDFKSLFIRFSGYICILLIFCLVGYYYNGKDFFKGGRGAFAYFQHEADFQYKYRLGEGEDLPNPWEEWTYYKDLVYPGASTIIQAIKINPLAYYVRMAYSLLYFFFSIRCIFGWLGLFLLGLGLLGLVRKIFYGNRDYLEMDLIACIIVLLPIMLTAFPHRRHLIYLVPSFLGVIYSLIYNYRYLSRYIWVKYTVFFLLGLFLLTKAFMFLMFLLGNNTAVVFIQD